MRTRTALATAIASAGGAIDFTGTLTVGDTYDVLVAYQKTGGGTGIADFQFVATDTHLSTASTFSGHDLVNLTGVALDASRKRPCSGATTSSTSTAPEAAKWSLRGVPEVHQRETYGRGASAPRLCFTEGRIGC